MRYEVHVAGRLSQRQVDEELAEVAEPRAEEAEVCTVLSGRFTDQAALHGFLHRLWARRLEVVRVRRTGD